MATGTERSKTTLHNFTAMPFDLRWGKQRFLRCMKVNSDGQISPLHRIDTNSSGSSDHHHHHPIQQRRSVRDRDRDNGSPRVGPTHPPPPVGGGRRFADGEDDDGGIAATREKVMLDLQTAADKMKDAFFKDGGALEEGEVAVSRPIPPPPPPPAAAAAEGEASRPWNLRTRRAACKMPPASGSVSGKNGGPSTVGGGIDGGGGKGLRVDAPPRPNPGFSPMRAPASNKSPSMHKTDGNTATAAAAAAASGEKREREKFSVPLSKREIEEDFFSMVGHRPPRRPKKRARFVQRQLDTLFPGLWLTEVTHDMYKVHEPAP